MKETRKTARAKKQNRDWFFARCNAFTGNGPVMGSRARRRAGKVN